MAFGRCTSCEALTTALAVERARYDALMEKYHALRLTGANPVSPATFTPPSATPEERALARAHDAFVDEMAGQFAQLPGVTAEQARQEAERLRRIVDGAVGVEEGP